MSSSEHVPAHTGTALTLGTLSQLPHAAGPGAQTCCEEGVGVWGRVSEPIHLQHAFVEEKEQLAV